MKELLLTGDSGLVGSQSHGSSRSTAALFSRTSLYSNRAFVPLNKGASNPESKLPRFYCIHSVSGTAGTDFAEFAEKLEPYVQFYGVQAPAAQMEKADFGQSVETIAAYYADALDKFQPSGTLYLGGYCIGAVIALAMANLLRERGRIVGPLIAIDGVPENTPFALSRFRPRYWAEFTHNAFLRLRGRPLRSVARSIRSNLRAMFKNMVKVKRGPRRLGGRFAIESVIDLSRYPEVHSSFIRRLFSAIFDYSATQYPGEVVVYEAAVKPALRLPQIGRIWRRLAPRTEVVAIMGTHHRILREPCVDVLATDLLERIRRVERNLPPSAQPL